MKRSSRSKFTDGAATMAYLRSGSGPRRLVFVHGLAGAAEVWKEQIAAFSGDFETVAVDLLGHGDSSAVSGRRALHESARLLDKFIASLTPKPTFTVGHSLGGSVIARMRTTAPTISARIFVDSPCIDGAAAVRIYRDFGSKFARSADQTRFVEDWFGGFLTERCPQETRGIVMENAHAIDPAWLVDLLTNLDADESNLDDARAVVMEGAQFFQPSDRLSWRRRLPHARDWRYAGRGHFYFLEDPDPFNAALRRMIDGLAD